MSEMVERVARAIEPAIWSDYDQSWDHPDADWFARRIEPTLHRARAAIAAMREPTDVMIGAAVRTFVRENHGIEHAPAVTWRAMIDAALAE